MKLTVFKVYDDEDWENSTWHYEYATDNVAEKEEELKDVPYSKKEYSSVCEFLNSSEEIKSDNYSDGEALDFVLETLNAIGL